MISPSGMPEFGEDALKLYGGRASAKRGAAVGSRVPIYRGVVCRAPRSTDSDERRQRESDFHRHTAPASYRSIVNQPEKRSGQYPETQRQAAAAKENECEHQAREHGQNRDKSGSVQQTGNQGR